MTIAEQTRQFMVTVVGEYQPHTYEMPVQVTTDSAVVITHIIPPGIGSIDFMWLLGALIMFGTIVMTYHFMRWCLSYILNKKRMK